MEDILNRVQEEINELTIFDNYLLSKYDHRDYDKCLIISDIRNDITFFRKLLLNVYDKIKEKYSL